MIETMVNTAGIDLEVWFEYTPRDVEEPLHYGAVIDIIAVRLGDVDILNLLNTDTLEDIEQQIEDQHNQLENYL